MGNDLNLVDDAISSVEKQLKQLHSVINILEKTNIICSFFELAMTLTNFEEIEEGYESF